MNKYGLNELREMFLSFFEEKEHLRLPGFSLIPKDDASLLLINSGMAPMKTWFTGQQKPPCKRVCTCQKCIRTGDIDSVGKTSRHGTYFEMLGNFSFGDYFKRDAIIWCWEFLTQRLGMNTDLLYPSVYNEDDEAYGIWKNIVGIAPERIIKLGKDDNFWDHGSGPCGPCSEVYFDRGAENGCGKPDCAPGCGCDRYVEVWNNVFTQFDNDGEGNYTELSQKNIDTGLGLERLACVCQGVNSIFEIDTVKTIVEKVTRISGRQYGEDSNTDVSVHIITDHMRAATMMINDGILPSNEGRGYVLRRLIRRAARHGRLLGIQDTFLSDVCGSVIDVNKNAYPDLTERDDFIKRIIRTEEEGFAKTIDTGISMLNGFIGKLKAGNQSILSGSDAFKLYDTFGFPPDLTTDILAEHNMTLDQPGFDEHMEAQRVRARTAREALGDLAWERIDLGPDTAPTQFCGYGSLVAQAEILAMVYQGEPCSTLGEGSEGYIVSDKTPFYAEMGGQSADTGVIEAAGPDSKSQNIFIVTDVQVNKTGKYIHHGFVKSGRFSTGRPVQLKVDISRREAIMRAHSATHLLHRALRDILGSHVNQAGSLVEPDRLRFDFTHPGSLSADEISDIEDSVNKAILINHIVDINEMPIDKAKELGATALFGEKYGDIVRVVKMGDSVELCGGTHLDYTARIGSFTVISEFSVAAGIRRIEALTGYEALNLLRNSRRQLREIATCLKVNSTDEIAGKIEQNLATIRELRGAVESVQSKGSCETARRLIDEAAEIGGIFVISAIVKDSGVDIERLKQIADNLRDLNPAVAAVLAVIYNDKLTIAASCGKTAIEKGINAGDLIRNVTKLCGGSGGGKPDFAMGGGKDISKLDDALSAVPQLIKDKLAL